MQVEARFKPCQYGQENINLAGKLLPERSRTLFDRYIGMMCGLTTCVPDTRFLLPAERTRRQAINLAEEAINNGEIETVEKLNRLIASHSEQLHLQLCEVLDENPRESGIVHGNTASEFFAEINARLRYNPTSLPDEGNFHGKVLTYKRGGRVVNKALAGGDIREDDGINYIPSVNLFAPPRAARPSKSVPELNDLLFIDADEAPPGLPDDGYSFEEGTIEEIFTQLPDTQLIDQVKEKLSQNRDVRLIVIPAVDALGRIWPWKEIAQVIDEENIRRRENGGHTIFKLLNSVQAIGRVETTDLQKPLEYYDAVVTVSYKGLGGAMNNAALLAKKDTLMKLYSPDIQLPWYIEELNAVYRTPLYCYQKLTQEGTISIPEIHSHTLALYDFFHRGVGRTFDERRKYMNANIKMVRERFIRLLSSNFIILDEKDGVRLTPGIVCFGLRNGNNVSHQIQTANSIKESAYRQTPALVLSGNIGPILRISIPEYFFTKFSSQEPYLHKMVDFAAATLNDLIKK